MSFLPCSTGGSVFGCVHQPLYWARSTSLATKPDSTGGRFTSTDLRTGTPARWASRDCRWGGRPGCGAGAAALHSCGCREGDGYEIGGVGGAGARGGSSFLGATGGWEPASG